MLFFLDSYPTPKHTRNRAGAAGTAIALRVTTSVPRPGIGFGHDRSRTGRRTRNDLGARRAENPNGHDASGGAPRPERPVLDAFVSELEARLDRAAALHPNPGTPVLSRLNRTEYGNAIRDLLDLDVDVAVLLPGDESSHGFDNIAEALGISPSCYRDMFPPQ